MPLPRFALAAALSLPLLLSPLRPALADDAAPATPSTAADVDPFIGTGG